MFVCKKRKSQGGGHCENEIRYREYIENKDYNCIAFWEVCSFINFLAEPYINRGCQYDLIHNVLWLIDTPYSWDPLGLQAKLRNAVHSCIDVSNEKLYHYKILQRLLNLELNLKIILRLIHALLSIEWIEREGVLPPINIMSLLANEEPTKQKICYEVLRKLDDYNRSSDEFLLENSQNEKDYILSWCHQKIEELHQKGWQNIDYDFRKCDDNRFKVDSMIDMIQFSINQVPQIESEPYLHWGDLCRF